MPREREHRVVALVKAVVQRPDARDCGRRWGSVQRIYGSLTGLDLPEQMPPREQGAPANRRVRRDPALQPVIADLELQRDGGAGVEPGT